MPGVSGLDVASEMLALRPDLPLALAQARGYDAMVARLRQVGAR